MDGIYILKIVYCVGALLSLFEMLFVLWGAFKHLCVIKAHRNEFLAFTAVSIVLCVLMIAMSWIGLYVLHGMNKTKTQCDCGCGGEDENP